jgi:hypothetical protein
MGRDAPPRSAASDSLVLAAARIAEDLISRCSPSEEAVVAFAASAVAAARTPDERAGPLALELADGLLNGVPAGRMWDETRGRLSAMKLFVWLLLQSPQAAQ